MPFPFRLVCDLLQSLDDEHNKKSDKTPDGVLVAQWFAEHRKRLNAPGSDACAILSTLLPEKRTDRVFSIQNSKLEGIVGQALCLGFSRVEELRLYRKPGLGRDLADCVEIILDKTPNSVRPEEITVETIDAVLVQVAARNNFSSPAVRALHDKSVTHTTKEAIGDIYQQFSARDAKWFTRLVLKDYQGVSLNHQTVFRNYHPLLPQMLKIRDDLNITTNFLRCARNEPADSEHLRHILKPKLGVKVGRQPWYKGRSIKHCVDMCRRRTVACEQKLDGEYCQIHIDGSKKDKCIQIFSKSGKDSTADKIGVHDAIRKALRLNKSDCPFKQSCILEGELVVYSTKVCLFHPCTQTGETLTRQQKRAILPFHKIRKHVTRGGRLLGTWSDSQPHAHEQLMIVYFDILMVDNESMLTKRHSERRQRLADIVNCEEGIAALVRLETIHFSRNTAAVQLRNAFANCIINRSEGLVLKPDEPYFDFTTTHKPHASGNIKLKKEYVQGMGDVGDFAVIGASYDGQKAKTYPGPPPELTHFYIACLENKNQVLAKTERPRFRHVNVVELNNHLMQTFQTHCRLRSIKFEDNNIFDISHKGWGDTKKPTVLFAEPPVFDMRCFSFDKDSNCDYWSMRFPMVAKIHFDRSYLDTMSFEELQDAAKEATVEPEQEDSQELRRWIKDLERADPRGIAVDAMTSQSTTSSELLCPTPSPMRQRTRRPSGGLDMITEESSPYITEEIVLGTASPIQAPMTPPRSSAIQAGEIPDSVGSQADENLQPKVRKRPSDAGLVDKDSKRPCEDDLRKQGRSSSKSSSSVKSPRRTSGVAHTSSQGRQVLSEVGINRSFGDHRLSQPHYQDAATTPTRPRLLGSSVPVEVESLVAETRTRSSPSRWKSIKGRPNTQSIKKPSSARQWPSQTASCLYAGSSCALARRSILLSPCIASYALVTDTLLRAHGVSDWEIDPASWARNVNLPPCGTQENPLCIDDDSFEGPAALRTESRVPPQSTCASTLQCSAPSICPAESDRNILGRSSPPPSSITETRRMPKLMRTKGRKICLVEKRRPEATDAFKKKIERANLTKQITRTNSGGKVIKREMREWVEVYDWRVLEDLADIEMGRVPVPKYDPWRQHFIGLA